MRVDDAKQISGTNTDRDPAAGRHTVSVANLNGTVGRDRAFKGCVFLPSQICGL